MTARIAFLLIITLALLPGCPRQSNEAAPTPASQEGVSPIPAENPAELTAVADPAYDAAGEGSTVELTLVASSTLPDAAGSDRLIRYSPYNLLDDDPKTVWSEGNPGPGTGASIDFIFGFETPRHDDDIEVDAIQVLPGYHDPRYFKANNRVRSLVLKAGEASPIALRFEDALAPQTVVFPRPLVLSARLSRFTLTITEVYPGDKYDDTCLSEVRFFNRRKRLATDYPPQVCYKEGRYVVSGLSGGKRLQLVNVMEPPIVFDLEENGDLHGQVSLGPAADTAENGAWEFDSKRAVFSLTFTYVRVIEYSLPESEVKKYEYSGMPFFVLGAGTGQTGFSGYLLEHGDTAGYIEGLPVKNPR